MSYVGEFRLGWRAVLSACIGMSAGYTINNYSNNILIPNLLMEFEWTNAQVALIGATVLVAAVCQPISGRVTDRYGPRAVATFGVIVGPLIYLCMSALQGSFTIYLLLTALQVALVATTTAAVVYSRIVAPKFDRALGLALAFVTCAPSIVGILLVPALSGFIDIHGWRAGYWAMAGFSAIFGVSALALIPSREGAAEVAPTAASRHHMSEILRSRAFHLIMAGMVLCNLTVMMQTTQLKVILLNSGVPNGAATMLISVYALGVIVGRLACGMALDRFPPHLVTGVAMALPGIGLLILASGTSSIGLAVAAVLPLGLSIGAEGDIAAYLAKRYFRIETYSTVLGFLMGAIALSGAMGAFALSASLTISSSFAPFLIAGALAALAGGMAFLRLGAIPHRSPAMGHGSADPIVSDR